MIDRKLVYDFTAMEDLEILKAKLTENFKREEELERELKEVQNERYDLKDKIAKIERNVVRQHSTGGGCLASQILDWCHRSTLFYATIGD